MRFLVLLVSVAGCKFDLDHRHVDAAGSATSCEQGSAQTCLDAASHSDLTWIQANIFDRHCTFQGCHNGMPNPAGMLDLRAGQSYAHLVNVTSVLEPPHLYVVPGDAKKSFLEVMLGFIAPQDADPPATLPSVGTMPLDSGPLCCQKLQAIDRWIVAGAMNN